MSKTKRTFGILQRACTSTNDERTTQQDKNWGEVATAAFLCLSCTQCIFAKMGTFVTGERVLMATALLRPRSLVSSLHCGRLSGYS